MPGTEIYICVHKFCGYKISQKMTKEVAKQELLDKQGMLL